MRPVNKGDAPQTYAKYGEAMNDLRTRIGRYCSYCERPLLNPEVEHIVPKNPETGDPTKELAWDNFLLACKNCNTSKGSGPVEMDTYLWPDQHNTAYAYRYERGRIHVRNTLSEKEQERATELLQLIGLDKVPDTDITNVLLNPTRFIGQEITKSLGTTWDRWRDRYQAWEDATEALEDFMNPADRAQAVHYLLKIIRYQGHWSTYAQVFAGEKDVIQALLNHEAFPGTATQYFEETEEGVFPKSEMNIAPNA